MRNWLFRRTNAFAQRCAEIDRGLDNWRSRWKAHSARATSRRGSGRGETLEDVARVAGIPLDRVERFAAPVFAEREHIAAQAMSSSVRRKGETSGHRSLRIAVTERLLGRGVDIDTIAWDSYRMDDGRWAVTADYLSGEAARHASFFYDLHGRFSVAGNDEARWLLGEHSAAKGPQPGRRRATERRPSEDDTEPTLDLSDDLALVRATQESDEPTVAVPRLLHPVPEPEPDPEPESPLGTNYATLGGDGYAEDSARVYAGLSDAQCGAGDRRCRRLGAGHRGELPGGAQPAR